MSRALELTPEKLAFIHGGTEQPVAPEKVEEGTLEQPALQHRSRGTVQPHRRNSGKGTGTVTEPAHATSLNMIPPLLVPLTTRLQPRTANALRRAYLEQKLKGHTPATQQEIVETALEDWLRRHEYL